MAAFAAHDAAALAGLDTEEGKPPPSAPIMEGRGGDPGVLAGSDGHGHRYGTGSTSWRWTRWATRRSKCPTLRSSWPMGR